MISILTLSVANIIILRFFYFICYAIAALSAIVMYFVLLRGSQGQQGEFFQVPVNEHKYIYSYIITNLAQFALYISCARNIVYRTITNIAVNLMIMALV